jgi:hypothetical protein
MPAQAPVAGDGRGVYGPEDETARSSERLFLNVLRGGRGTCIAYRRA